jgi:hypothetical protein
VSVDLKEAITEGAGLELIPHEDGGWYLRIGILNDTISGRTRAEVFLKVAQIFLEPEVPGEQ